MKHPRINKINIVIDCDDAGIMADFYSNMNHRFGRGNLVNKAKCSTSI